MDIMVEHGPCTADEQLDLDPEYQAAFTHLTDDGTDVYEQVELACHDVLGDDYHGEECTSSGPNEEECVTVIEPPPVDPADQPLQDDCVTLVEAMEALGCSFQE